jgi:hypothetical protein
MQNKEILQELSTMKDYLSDMYKSLEIIRDNLPEDIKNGTNKARELLSKLSNTLDYQADLIIFKDRNDIDNLKKTNEKIKGL